jgi:hypothetical protein
MGLMDKMKVQATQIAQKTQETARDSKVKFDQAQAKRRADAMLRNLGALVYAERTGRAAPDSQAKIDKLVADISAHEAENGISLAPESADHHAAPQADGAGADPTGFPQAQPDQATSTGFPPEAGTTTQV